MTGTRTYGEACAAAHGLDLIGERWALLIVRELLFGPMRFADLRAGLPQAGPNRMSQRLRDLEGSGIVRRRKLGPPAPVQVYELTDWGRQLEPVIVELGRWGRRSPWRTNEGNLSVNAVMVRLLADWDPDLGRPFTARFAIHLGEHHFVADVVDGRIQVSRGEPDQADAVIACDLGTFNALLSRSRTLAELRHAGDLTLTGDIPAVRRLLGALTLAKPAPAPALAPESA